MAPNTITAGASVMQADRDDRLIARQEGLIPNLSKRGSCWDLVVDDALCGSAGRQTRAPVVSNRPRTTRATRRIVGNAGRFDEFQSHTRLKLVRLTCLATGVCDLNLNPNVRGIQHVVRRRIDRLNRDDLKIQISDVDQVAHLGILRSLVGRLRRLGRSAASRMATHQHADDYDRHNNPMSIRQPRNSLPKTLLLSYTTQVYACGCPEKKRATLRREQPALTTLAGVVSVSQRPAVRASPVTSLTTLPLRRAVLARRCDRACDRRESPVGR